MMNLPERVLRKMQHTITVRAFTMTPGGRYTDDGPSPGELFLENHLAPAFENACGEGATLLVDLDGTAGYASSFLEEAFGGLSRSYTAALVHQIVRIKSEDEPYLIEDIWLYVDEAQGE